MQKLGFDQVQTVALFAVALGACGIAASHKAGPIARAAAFLPMLEEIPGLLTLKAVDVKAQWIDLDTTERAAVYAACAARFDLADKGLEHKVEALLDAGLKIVEGIAEAVAALEAPKAAEGAAA